MNLLCLKVIGYLFSFFLVIHINAQSQVPAQYRADYNRMMANNSLQRINSMPFRYGGFYNSEGLLNLKYEYVIILKDSSLNRITSRIFMDTSSKKSYLVYIDKDRAKSDSSRNQKVYCTETVRIFRDDNKNLIRINGISTDSCWLFKVVEGKISAYSPLSEVDEIDSRYITAFQIDDGPVISVNSVLLEQALLEDKNAMSVFKKKDYYSAIIRYNRHNKKE